MTTIWKFTSLHQISTHHVLPNLICPINLNSINHGFYQVKFSGIKLSMVISLRTNHISKKIVKQLILYGHPTRMHNKFAILRVTFFLSLLFFLGFHSSIYQSISHKDLNISSFDSFQGPVKEPPNH